MKRLNLILALCAMLAILWQPNYSQAQTTYVYGTAAEEFSRVSAVNPTDNSFLVGGYENAAINPSLLSSISSTGILNWAKNYSHSQGMYVSDIHMKSNGNALVLSVTTNTSVNRHDALLMEVDATGTVLWSKSYTNTSLDVSLRKITALASGDYILTGNSSVNDIGSGTNYYLTMMRVNSLGVIQWIKRNLNSADVNMSINEGLELANGNVLLTGHAWHSVNGSGGSHNGYVAEIDVTDGSTIWNKVYPSSLEVVFFQSYELPGGDIVIAGRLRDDHLSAFTTRSQFFVRITSTGTVVTAKEYDFAPGNVSFTFKVDATTNTFFFAGVEAISDAAVDKDNYLMELDENGDFVDAYRFVLPDNEGYPSLELNGTSINMFTNTKSFPAVSGAAANNDLAMFVVDRANPLEDCNVNQFTASPEAFTFLELGEATLSDDTGFTLAEENVSLVVENYAFLQADVCQESPLCEMNAGIVYMGCSAAGTCDPSDDTHTLLIGAENISGAGPSNRYYVYDATNTPNVLIGDYNYGDTDVLTLGGQTSISLLFVDFDNPECDTLITGEWEACAPECPLTLECPDDISVTLDGSGCDVIVDYELNAVVCLDATLTLLSGLPSGSAFPLGMTTVSYELHDDCTGITLNCSFNVNVSNVTPTSADYVLSGSAVSLGEENCYRLTTATEDDNGSIFYQSKMNLDYDFDLSFDINLGDSNTGADGVAFILQPISSDLGTTGGGIGYGGVSPSVAIEFDTYRNNSWALDPFHDHISFQKNGDTRHNTAGYLDANVGYQVITADMENGNYHSVEVSWKASTKELTYTYDNIHTQTITQDIANTIFGGNPNVFWGWSAATGSSVNEHTVCINSVSFVEGLTVDPIITDITCEEDGMIDLTVTGGIPGYTFLWSDDSTDEDLSSITDAGDYVVTITDACGHTIEHTYTVGQEENCTCELFPTAFLEGCDGMGTVDILDDMLLVYIDATATNPGASNMFNVFDLGTSSLLGTFSYGSGTVITVPYTSDLNIYFEDADDASCDGSITLNGLETCSPLPEPIPCAEPSVFYQVYQETEFLEYDPTTLSYTTIHVNPYGINAIGYNIEDGFVYGIRALTNHLVRVGSDGVFVDLGSVSNLPVPTTASDSWYAGDFDANGNLVVATNNNSNVYSIDVNVFPLAANVINLTGANYSNFADFSFLPSENEFYGLSGDEVLYSINTSGLLTLHGTVNMPDCAGYGASYADASGALYFFCNSTGALYEVDRLAMTGVLVDEVNVVLASNDGASCPYTTFCTDCDCEIIPTLVQEDCDNMGTSDISDDIITLFVNATANNGSASFNVLDGVTVLGTFTYGVGGLITVPYSASISLAFEDAANSECIEFAAIDLQDCEYCTDLNINITVDNYPKETTWELVDDNGNVIQDSNGHLGQNPDGTIFDYNFCLPDGCYEFIIYDSYGDGICCDPFYGNGSYTVTDMTSGTVLGQGGQFGFSETTSFCIGDTAPVSCTYENLKNNTFESGWGFWVDGGEDAERMLSNGTVGNWSIRLRDGTSESVMTSKQLDLTDYSEATIDFAYRPISMDNATEGFFLEVSLDGGVTFSIVEEWNQGDEFVNGRNYLDDVVIPGPFSADTRFRFKCDASGDGDYVFIDRVTIKGCKIDDVNTEAVAAPMSRTTSSTIQKPSLAIGKLYPNPAHDYVNIDMKSRIEGAVSINIYTTTGQMVYSVEEYAYEGNNQFTVNLDRLSNGTYMVEINDGKKTDIQRLIIMK